MMDYIAGLVQRGLISPDVAQGLVQQVADLKNQRPFESGGGAPTNSVFVPRTNGQYVKMPYQDRPVEVVPDEPLTGTNPVFKAKRPFRRQGNPEYYDTGKSPAGSSPRYQEQKDRRLDKDQ